MRFLRLDSSQFLAYHPCKSLWFCCKRNKSLTPHLYWSDNCQRHRQLLRNFSSPCDYLIVSFFRWIPLIKNLFAPALVLSGRGGLELLFGSKKKHQVEVSPSNGHIEVFFFVVLNLVTFCIKFVWSGYCKELQYRWSLQFWTVVLKPSSRSTNSFAVAHEICVKLILYRVATPLNLMFKMLDPGSCCHCFFCAVNYHNLGEVGCSQSPSIEFFWQQAVHLSCSRRISFEALMVDKISWCKIVKLMLLMV